MIPDLTPDEIEDLERHIVAAARGDFDALGCALCQIAEKYGNQPLSPEALELWHALQIVDQGWQTDIQEWKKQERRERQRERRQIARVEKIVNGAS